MHELHITHHLIPTSNPTNFHNNGCKKLLNTKETTIKETCSKRILICHNKYRVRSPVTSKICISNN